MEGESLALIDDLEEGDRVRLEADAAVDAFNDDDVDGMFKRGNRVLLDDVGTVVDVGDGRVVVELDEQAVRSSDDGDYVSTRFRVEGETVYSKWELVDEAEDKHKRPADAPVAFLTQLSREE
jgi:hypothetical protein